LEEEKIIELTANLDPALKGVSQEIINEHMELKNLFFKAFI
jgi:hypothetical protein